MLILAGEYPQGLAALDSLRAWAQKQPADLYWRALVLDKLHQVKPALANYQTVSCSQSGQVSRPGISCPAP